jgi:polysaccharide export outer membrane protein
MRDYRVGSGDAMEFRVFGVEELTQAVRVGADGSISLPLLGSFHVAGRTVGEVEELTVAKLTEQRLVRDPQVSVRITEYRSQPVYVLGAVNRPGQFVMTSSLSLVDAIALAGGFDPQRVGETITITHNAPKEGIEPGGSAAAFPARATDVVQVKALTSRSDLSANLPLRAGDIIHVSEYRAEVFYVVGDVGKAGAYEFPKDQPGDLLVSQALIRAGGPTRTARAGRGLLVRTGEKGEREQIALDFNAIIRGKKTDYPIRPNDIIYIPGSAARSFGQALTQAVPWAVANSLVYGLIF